MSSFNKDVQSIIASNPGSAESIKDVINLVDKHLASIALTAKRSNPGPKMSTVDDDFNSLTSPFDNDPAAEAVINKIALHIIKALHDLPENRSVHIQAVTDALNSIKDRPALHKTAREAGKLLLAALAEDAGIK